MFAFSQHYKMERPMDVLVNYNVNSWMERGFLVPLVVLLIVVIMFP
jgi:hypothetical protein